MQTQSPAAGDRSATVAGMPLYSALFFISGFPALIYQIVWQRALFTMDGRRLHARHCINNSLLIADSHITHGQYASSFGDSRGPRHT